MLNFREEELLKSFYHNPDFLPKFNAALKTLHSLGVIEFLKERSKVKILRKDINLEVEAARSFGYNEALDSLIFLKEMFLESLVQAEVVPPDFGGIDAAVRADNLTPQEADALRYGTKLEYDTSDTFPKPKLANN